MRKPAEWFGSLRRPAPAPGADTRAFVLQVAAFAFGLTFGVTATTAGLNIAKTMAMSMMFAGASQFTVLAIMSSNGSMVTAFVAATLLNARYGLLGLSVAHHLRMRFVERALAALVLGDPPVALALSEEDHDRRGRVYWITALWTAAGWLAGTLLGAIGGSSIGDPKVLGLDAALPVLMLAILGQSFRDRLNVAAAVSGAAIGIAFISFSPTGLPVLAGGLGALVPLVMLRRSPSEPPAVDDAGMQR